MRYGIHLPQFGSSLSAGAIQRAAAEAEALGFNDVWVSDHLVVAADQMYPSPILLDPLVALSFAAAVTQTIGIGTSVLVAPQYPSPLAVANSLATLDFMSAGRLTVGAGIGWSRAEYAALGARFQHRGQRLEEIIRLWRTAWKDDPAHHDGQFYPFSDIRVLPHPAHDIPIWLGGTSEFAVERATRVADGYHAIGLSVDDAAALVGRIRKVRPEDSFTVSLRAISPDDADHRLTAARRDQYEAAGIQHLVFDPHGQRLQGMPDGGGIDEWMRRAGAFAEEMGL